MICARCDKPIPSSQTVQLDGSRYCQPCAKEVKGANDAYSESVQREFKKTEEANRWRRFLGGNGFDFFIVIMFLIVIIFAIMLRKSQ